mgnify:CR=1 FL=1
MEKILVTGSSGFIGMHLCQFLLEEGVHVIGVDNMNSYYSKQLKYDRLNILSAYKNFTFNKSDISDLSSIKSIFLKNKPDKVVNLAAQAGVRYSIENPHSYIDSNVVGFMNILECCRNYGVKGLVYASSSSVYGGNTQIPFSESHNVDKPISIYAATKKSNELMAYSYSHLYGLHTTALRFFTVYGPWGRPDMAMYLFADKMIKGEPITVFNNGLMYRDFTYIDDIVSGIVKSLKKNYKYEIFNLGNNKCEKLMDMIRLLENCLNVEAKPNYTDIQPGDVEKTVADIDYSKKMLGYEPHTPISKGIPKFIEWYKAYQKI